VNAGVVNAAVKRALIFFLASSLLACGSDEEASSSSSGGSDDDERPSAATSFEPIAGGIGWNAEEPFVYGRPSNAMRDAQYSVRDQQGVVLIVSHFDMDVGGGGDVMENVRRWTGQFDEDGRVASTPEERVINDLEVTRVDVSGTFIGRMGLGPSGGSRPNWRMMGAIVEGPQGLVFFKLIGPAAGVEVAQEAFEQLVLSIHPA